MNAGHPSLLTTEAKAPLQVVQEWEGYVVEMSGDECVARLVDLTGGSTHEEEEAIIPRAAISDRDVVTVDVGSIFRWVIGYERSPAGARKWVSRIRFRDQPRLTEDDFREARRWARETFRALRRTVVPTGSAAPGPSARPIPAAVARACAGPRRRLSQVCGVRTWPACPT